MMTVDPRPQGPLNDYDEQGRRLWYVAASRRRALHNVGVVPVGKRYEIRHRLAATLRVTDSRSSKRARLTHPLTPPFPVIPHQIRRDQLVVARTMRSIALSATSMSSYIVHVFGSRSIGQVLNAIVGRITVEVSDAHTRWFRAKERRRHGPMNLDSCTDAFMARAEYWISAYVARCAQDSSPEDIGVARYAQYSAAKRFDPPAVRDLVEPVPTGHGQPLLLFARTSLVLTSRHVLDNSRFDSSREGAVA